MQWFEDKPDGDIAKSIRRDMRLYRREKGKRLNGVTHRFSFKDIKAIWCVDHEPVEHVIVTHHHDSMWQHYWRHPEKGWVQQQTHPTRDAATAAVGVHMPEQPVSRGNSKTKRDSSGRFVRKEDTIIHTTDGGGATERATYVFAGWKDKPDAIKVKVNPETHPWTARQMVDILDRLGCITYTQTVKTPVPK